MTVGVPLVNGATFILASMIDSPRNMMPSSEPMITRVVRAFFHSGFLNAGTPFEIASIPVIAVQPDANARRTRKPESVVAGCTTVSVSGRTSPSAYRIRPVRTRAPKVKMKR